MSSYRPDLLDLYNCLLPKPETFTPHTDIRAGENFFRTWTAKVRYFNFSDIPPETFLEFKTNISPYSFNLEGMVDCEPNFEGNDIDKLEGIIFTSGGLEEEEGDLLAQRFYTGKKQLGEFISVNKESESQIRAEGYYIYCGYRCTILLAYSTHGIFNGLQTILQVCRYFSVNGISSDISEFSILDFPRLAMRGFHLDLKELLPTFKYAKELIQFLGHFKYNLILLEYEDKFPYSGSLSAIPHKFSWTVDQIKEILALCASNFIEVIPLVQVFGHVERYIRKEPYKHLTEGFAEEEKGKKPSCLCPLNPDSLDFAHEMILQIVKAHPDSTYLHLGADEVYDLGSCQKCRDYVSKNSKSALYIGFLNKLISVTVEQGKIPIIWDDYIQKFPEELDRLDPKTVLMYWGYNSWKEGPIIHAQPKNMYAFDSIMPYFQFYSENGFDVIGAPSTSSNFDLFLPGLQKRIENVAIHSLKAKQSGSKKVVITSWAGCGNPLDTQVPILPIAADLLWVSPDNYQNLSYPRYNAAIQTQIWGIPRNQFIEWLLPLLHVSEIVKFHHFPVPSREAVPYFEETIYFLNKLNKTASDNRRIIQSLIKSVHFRFQLAEIMKMWWEIWEISNNYTNSEEKFNQFPTVDYLEELLDKSSIVLEGYEQMKDKICHFYTSESNQIEGGQFEELFSEYPRYTLPAVIKEFPEKIKKLLENFDEFFMYFLTNGIGL